tara:strand:+ start:5135 stop:5551 length:417 start_codon:yes stop_codon:yes gene_type:complete
MALKPLTSKDFKKSRNFSDISMNFLKNPFTKDTTKVTNQDAIKQAVKNLILTVPGEKFFNPQFGSSVTDLLFEPMDAFLVDRIRMEITNTIQNFEPRIVLELVEVIADYDANAMNVSIQYEIIGLPITEQISFVLKRP